jgi:hypothetical protein
VRALQAAEGAAMKEVFFSVVIPKWPQPRESQPPW